MLTNQMQSLIHDYSAGLVATVNSDGSPAVSPKGTFVILDSSTLAFGNIRSPGTLKNLRCNPEVEICFIDVLNRKAVRVSGKAVIAPKAKAPEPLLVAFQGRWPEYLPRISAFVSIHIKSAEMILSPAYDLGYSEKDLRQANMARFIAMD